MSLEEAEFDNPHCLVQDRDYDAVNEHLLSVDNKEPRSDKEPRSVDDLNYDTDNKSSSCRARDETQMLTTSTCNQFTMRSLGQTSLNCSVDDLNYDSDDESSSCRPCDESYDANNKYSSSVYSEYSSSVDDEKP